MDDIATRGRRIQTRSLPTLSGQAGAVPWRCWTTAADELVRRLRDAINVTSDNKTRVHNAISAYFDFVDGNGPDHQGAFRLVFESDLRNEPAVRERAERTNRPVACRPSPTRSSPTPGCRGPRRELLSISLTAVSEVGARYWLAERTGGAQGERVTAARGAGLAWHLGLPAAGRDRQRVH